jgi:predicted AAA+ superfamily ATPase
MSTDMTMQPIKRALAPRLVTALEDTPAVMVVGPRQAGKSTLVKELIAGDADARYLTLDDLGNLEAARRDPVGFVESRAGTVAIDEIQRAPELLLPIKAAIDVDRRPGRFILTGSAQVMLLPTVSESLAGRIEVHTLWPFSQAEIAGIDPGGVPALLEQGTRPPTAPSTGREEMIERLARGGFPEAVSRPDDRRAEWLDAYLSAIVQRDLRDLANIERLAEIPALLASLAARVRAPLNKADVGSSVGIPRSSLDRYLTLLEHVFLVRRPADAPPASRPHAIGEGRRAARHGARVLRRDGAREAARRHEPADHVDAHADRAWRRGRLRARRHRRRNRRP